MKIISIRNLLACTIALCGLTLSPLHAAAKPKGKGKGKGNTPKTAVQEPAPSSQIDLLTKTGIAMNSLVLASLDEPVPDVRTDIVQLQQELLDEAAQHPVTTPACYQAASRLCAGWLNAFDERKKRSGSIGQTAPPTKDLEHTRKTVLHWPDDILTFAREQRAARAKRRTDKQKQSFFDDAARSNWESRAQVLRTELDKLYSLFREELRKPASPN